MECLFLHGSQLQAGKNPIPFRGLGVGQNRFVIQSFVDFLLTKTNDGAIISKFKTLDFLGNLIVSYSGFFRATDELLSDDYKEILNSFSKEEKLLPNEVIKNTSKEMVEKIEKINSEIKNIKKEAKWLFNKLHKMYHLVFQDFVEDLVKIVKTEVKR